MIAANGAWLTTDSHGGVHHVAPCGTCGAVVLAERGQDHQDHHEALGKLAEGVAGLMDELASAVGSQKDLADAVQRLAQALGSQQLRRTTGGQTTGGPGADRTTFADIGAALGSASLESTSQSLISPPA